MLQGYVRCEERDQGGLRVEAEGVVVEVNGVEVREVEDRGEEGGERFGDFAEEAAGEDVGEVGNLVRGVSDRISCNAKAADACTYPQCLLCCEDLAEQLACTNAECVAEDAHFLNILHGAQVRNVSLEVFSSVQLQTPPFEGEDLGRGSHF